MNAIYEEVIYYYVIDYDEYSNLFSYLING